MAKTAAAKQRGAGDVIPNPDVYCPDRGTLDPVIEALVVLIPYPESECDYTNATVTVTKRKKSAQRGRRAR
jgi:hypothetical protein